MNPVHSIRSEVACSSCGANLIRVLWNYERGRPISKFFCDNVCKAAWQRAQREALGYTREWLIEQYITLERTANDIARAVGRNPKRVWEWIVGYGIPTRPRGSNVGQLPKDGSGFRGKKHTDKAKDGFRRLRLKDGHVPYLRNGAHWLKSHVGQHPNWKGGITPERQALYSSPEWKECVVAVWKRDNAICRRCGLDHRAVVRNKPAFHIHHVDGFSITESRAIISNLVLLCAPCHRWVHGKSNKERMFLGRGH